MLKLAFQQKQSQHALFLHGTFARLTIPGWAHQCLYFNNCPLPGELNPLCDCIMCYRTSWGPLVWKNPRSFTVTCIVYLAQFILRSSLLVVLLCWRVDSVSRPLFKVPCLNLDSEAFLLSLVSLELDGHRIFDLDDNEKQSSYCCFKLLATPRVTHFLITSYFIF